MEEDNLQGIENIPKDLSEKRERVLAVAEARKGHLDFLYYQYDKGYPLDETQIKLLERHGYFKEEVDRKRAESEEQRDVSVKFRRPLYKPNTKVGAEFLRQKYGDKLNYDEWRPKSVLDHTTSFINWINSMTFGAFSDMTLYEPYLFYKNQATFWLDDSLGSDATDQEIEDFRLKDIDRCSRNTLYFANKYGRLLDSGIGGGAARYIAKEHHAVIYFLLDCGYSFMLGKGRQIGATSALGIAASAKISFNSNYFLKYIAEDERTVEEIFRDKIKFPYSQLPNFIKSNVESFSGTKFALGKKDKKTGSFGYPNSRIEVVPPSVTAINGGSPDLVYIDEIGQIPILTEMINEGRPTMFAYDDKGNLTMKRQIVAWGCVCAGTKVTTLDGRIINVEELKKEDGIIGYDILKNKKSNEPIIWMQPPTKKECYKIITNTGRELSCSFDHPILVKKTKNTFDFSIKNYNIGKKYVFLETQFIEVGNEVVVVENEIEKLEKIVSREYIGVKDIYNLTAGTTNTYIANGIVTHNTGAKTSKGRGAYEKEWYRVIGLWNNMDFQSGIIPLFFSWHTRCTPEFYKKERAYYYGARIQEKDIDLETSKIQFNQHYPTTYKDMFLTTTSTLVNKTIIQEGLNKCRTLKHTLRPVFGRFEPIFDYSKVEDENSDLPYKVTGAKFIPIDEEDDLNKVTTLMFLEPEKWEHRYFQGTDPIESETGHSKMASLIWDNYYKCPVCLVNFRKQYSHKESFLQCMLMGIYYDKAREDGKKRGVPELIESNIGTAYKDYKESKGFFRSFVMNTQLPRDLQGGAKMIGIDNHSTRSGLIISKMSECIKNYHERMYFNEIFQQLDSFVMKITQAGKETWERQNKVTDYDDVLFALVYAYICSTLSTREPKDVNVESKVVEGKSRLRYKIKRDSNFNVIREAVRI